jgi:DnaJ-class molecular chaperone
LAAPKKDFYRTLGVSETAPADEVKRAYRKLAKRYHPDVTGGDKAKEAKFKEISEAYETIGDEKKRAAYDLERKSPFGAGMPPPGSGPFRGGPNPFTGRATTGGGVHVDLNDLFQKQQEQGGGFGDLFSELFGGGGGARARPSARGADVHAKMEIELPVAALGGEVPILVDGKRWNVKVPAGVEEGQNIRLAGKGQAGRAGAGDLLLEVHIKPHPQFRKSGHHDLEVDAHLAVDQAVLGGKVDVPTLEGKVSLTIPAGTSSGMKLRLRGKGIPKKDGTRGDLYAVTQIQLPKEIPPRAKELIAEFAKLTKK